MKEIEVLSSGRDIERKLLTHDHFKVVLEAYTLILKRHKYIVVFVTLYSVTK